MQPTEASPETNPRTIDQWRDYLTEYSADVLRVSEANELSEVSDEQRAAGWLGFPGATEEQLTELETRLGTRLPPSYRAFLGASDGWLRLSSFMWEMATTSTVDWQTTAVDLGGDYLDDEEDEELTAEYAMLDRALLISGHGDAQYWLLDPGDVSENGEWAAYIWASWYPGLGKRHASFADLVQAERTSFERLQGYRGRGVHPEGIEELLAEGRAQALRGEVEQATESFERAAVKGSGIGLYLEMILHAFSDLRPIHHEIRNKVLSKEHVIAAIGADQVRAEAIPLYLRRTIEDHGPLTGLPRLESLARLVPELHFSPGESNDDWIARAAAHVPPRMPEPPAFQQALDLARDLATRNRPDEAWTTIETALPQWYSDNPNHIAPVILLTDPILRDLIDPDRARLIAATPRGKLASPD